MQIHVPILYVCVIIEKYFWSNIFHLLFGDVWKLADLCYHGHTILQHISLPWLLKIANENNVTLCCKSPCRVMLPPSVGDSISCLASVSCEGVINVREQIYLFKHVEFFFLLFFWLKCHTIPQPLLYLSVSSTSLYSLALTLAADSVDGWLPNKYIQNGNYLEQSFRTFSLCTAVRSCGVLAMLSKKTNKKKEKKNVDKLKLSFVQKCLHIVHPQAWFFFCCVSHKSSQPWTLQCGNF